jgi:hypothetical protein
VETAGVEPAFDLGASEALFHKSYVPDADGWIRTTRPEAAGLQPVELTVARASAWLRGGRARTGASGVHDPDASVYTTATMKRGRPDSNRQPFRPTSDCSPLLSYAPVEVARVGFEPTSRAHETREETAPLPRNLAGRIRTCDLRRPKPVGWPAPLLPASTTGASEAALATPTKRTCGLCPRVRLSSGGRSRTCLSRLTIACPTD